MKIISNFKDNVIPDIYGMNDGETNEGINQRSFPFEVIDMPVGTKYLAFTLLDFDTTSIVGFPWIHWSMTDIPVDNDSFKISDNFSLTSKYPQGINSLNSIVQESRDPIWYKRNKNTNLMKRYACPRPKSGTHNYRMQVFALNNKLNLNDGFYLSNLMDKVDEYTLDQAVLNFKYERK